MKFNLILTFIRQDLIDRYHGSVLGIFWAFLLPLTFIFIYTLIFSQVMHTRLIGIEDDPYSYSIYLISGMLLWSAFSTTLLRVASFFEEKRSLIKKVPLPLFQLPLAIVGSSMITFFITLFLFIVFLTIVNKPVFATIALMIPLVLITQIVAYGIGIIVASLSIFLRDLREMVPIFLQIWFWLTPIVYPVSIIPADYQPLFSVNILFTPIIIAQKAVLMGEIPRWIDLLMPFAVGIMLVMLGLKIFRILERDIRDLL